MSKADTANLSANCFPFTPPAAIRTTLLLVWTHIIGHLMDASPVLFRSPLTL